MNKMMLLKTQVKNIKCFVFQSICLISFIAIYFKIQGPDVLQPGGAETRTCPMTGGCSIPHSLIVLVSEPKGHALCSASLPAPASISMETSQDVPDQQQGLNLPPPLWCADQTPQYSCFQVLSRDFCQ